MQIWSRLVKYTSPQVRPLADIVHYNYSVNIHVKMIHVASNCVTACVNDEFAFHLYDLVAAQLLWPNSL